jgi:hypothetical protein
MAKAINQANELRSNLEMNMYSTRNVGEDKREKDIRITRIPEGWIYEFIYSDSLVFVRQENLDLDLDLDAEDDLKIPKIGPTGAKYRKKILKIIYKLWKGGATYKEIANHLNEHNVTTFSGKGKWHAQSIHRHCVEVKNNGKKA